MKFKVQPFFDGKEVMEADMIDIDLIEMSIEFISFYGDRQYNALTQSDLCKVLHKIASGIRERLPIIDISKWI